MLKAISITQEGIGRLSKEDSPSEYDALYTEGLETCVAIMLVSVKGISLIHATQVLNDNDLFKELEWHENLAFCAVAINPNFYPGGVQDQNFISNYNNFFSDERIQQTVNREEGSAIKLHMASGGYVTLKRAGGFETDNKPSNLLELPESRVRTKINELNSFFLYQTERKCADFQFDGNKYTDCPDLDKTTQEIEALVSREERFQSCLLTQQLQADHKLLVSSGIVAGKMQASDGFLFGLDINALADRINQTYSSPQSDLPGNDGNNEVSELNSGSDSEGVKKPGYH